jgi:1L-myo-inositol 1-phosphate cytidylyltransferase / CDP-L-myo-inositol myo-inositolphosphotransferase
MNCVLDTAIVFELAASSPGTGPGGGRQDVGLLTRLAGLTVLERMVLTLQRSGITKIIVVTQGDDEPLKRAVAGSPRISTLIEWRSPKELCRVVGVKDEDPALVIVGAAVFSQALIEAFQRQASTASGAVLAAHDGGSAGVSRGYGMLVLRDAGHVSDLSAGGDGLQRVIEAAASQGRLVVVDAHPSSPRWYYPLCSAADFSQGERLVLQSPKAIDEGFVDRYVNRKLAFGFTRWFLRAGWSPNAVTWLSVFIGFLAAACFAQAAYLAGLIGALLFQFSAVIDCCDGDVARLTFRESRFGEYLDLIGDNAVHMAVFAAIGWAGYARSGMLMPGVLAGAAIIGTALSLWVVMRLKAQRGQRAWNTPGQQARSEFILKHVASRDFTVIVLLFAVLDLFGLFLWLAAFGTNLFWMLSAWASRPALTTVRA